MQKILPRVIGFLLIFILITATGFSARTSLNLKFATAGNDDSLEAKALFYFKKLVEERTEGDIRIDVYTDGVLGNEEQLAEGIQMGTVDGIIIPSFKYSTFVPEMELLNLPFLFTGEKHWRAALFGSVGEEFADFTYQRRGDMLLGFMTNGPRNIFSRKEIIGWVSFKGIKIRVMTIPSDLSVWRALGAKPQAIAEYDLTAALQTGLVDAAENTFINIKKKKFYEPPSQYILRTEHQITPLLFLLGRSSFQKLPEELREVLISCGGEAAMWQVDKNFEENKKVEKELVNKYWVKITELTPEEKVVWREKAAEVHTKVAERLGLSGVLQIINNMIPKNENKDTRGE